jgi:CDGSH-type Zn-finger protein
MTTITVRPQGPNLVTGPATLTDASGAAFTIEDGRTVGLCRCGHSQNKPFCDGSHKAAGWDQPAGADLTRLPAGVSAT